MSARVHLPRSTGLVGALGAVLLAGTLASPASAAPTCHLAGTWHQTTDQVGSSDWTITADGKATESGLDGAHGTATLAGNVLTIESRTPDPEFNGRYRWTLGGDCHGSGTLTFESSQHAGETHSSTVVGPPPTEAPRCGSRRVAHAASVNEVRVAAVNPDVQVHRAGTPEECVVPATKDMVLQPGDEIACDPDGTITLQFADNSTVVVKNTTQLKIASFFTEGGVVKTEILLKMGEVAAKVHKSAATKSDFRIKAPTGTASVRARSVFRDQARAAGDADFSVFYDPGSRTSLWSVRAGAVDVSNGKGKQRLVTAGMEALLAGNTIAVAHLGKAGARGGINRKAALDTVLKLIAKRNGPCGVSTPRAKAFGVEPAPGGWAVAVKLTGRLKGTSKWRVKGRRLTAVNPLAKKLARGCH